MSRLGGDEFTVLLTGDFTVKFLEKKAEELLHATRLKMNGTRRVPIPISVGIACGRARSIFEKRKFSKTRPLIRRETIKKRDALFDSIGNLVCRNTLRDGGSDGFSGNFEKHGEWVHTAFL